MCDASFTTDFKTLRHSRLLRIKKTNKKQQSFVVVLRQWKRHLTHITVPIVWCQVQVFICVPQKDMIGKWGETPSKKTQKIVV